ncbi:MAG: hypothetical protein QM817_11605 [Archangium sp.]
MRYVVLLALLAAPLAHAENGLDGLGHVSVGGGFRWIPNWWFRSKAAEFGTPVSNTTIDGGPQGTASFGLGVTANLVVAIDAVFGYQSFSLNREDGGVDNYSSTFGAVMLGARLGGADVLFKGFMPYIQVQVGPSLSILGGPREVIPEKAIFAISASGGATYRFSRSYGITLDVRYVQARNSVPEISGINVGGVWFSAMFTIFFPPSPKADLGTSSF